MAAAGSIFTEFKGKRRCLGCQTIRKKKTKNKIKNKINK
jgi:hypothetical protein